jgi:ankyrin repeat protein
MQHSIITPQSPIIVQTLHRFCRMKDVSSVKELLEQNSDNVSKIINWSHNGDTALITAINVKCVEIVELLLETNKCMVESKNFANLTPFYIAASNATDANLKIMKLLFQYSNNINVDLQDSFGRTALHLICKQRTNLLDNSSSNSITMLKMILKKSSKSVNVQDCNHETPLHAACFKNSAEKVKLLLKFGADPTILKLGRDSVLHIMCRNSNCDIKIIDMLCKHKDIDKIINIQNSDGYTALHNTCFFKLIKVVELLLLNENIDISLKNKYGKTPLHTCCDSYTYIPEIAKLLLNFIISNKNNKNNYVAVNVAVNITDGFDETPLHIACQNTSISPDIIKLLLIAGSSTIVLNQYNKTPFEIFNGDFDLAIIYK